MNVFRVELPRELETVELVPLGDVHTGEEHFAEREFLEARAYVLAKPNRYVIVNGDIVNLALKFSKSDVYGETLSPMEEIMVSAEYLRPIKDRILLILPGNHEERLYKETGIDAGFLLASELGLREKYARESALLFISVGLSETNKKLAIKDRTLRNVYSVYCHHGFGGGRSNGSKLNKAISLDGIVDADLYIMGHHHTPSATKSDYMRLDYASKTMKQVTRTYMIHGAWLKFGGYGERFGYSPSSIVLARAILNGHGKKYIEVVI